MNKKGFVLSTYVYILLVFFLLLLGTMLAVMNNTKLLSNKLKEQSNSTSGLSDKDYSFILLGDKEVILIKGAEYEEPGFIAKTSKGVDISDNVKVIGSIDVNNMNEYTLTYKITYNGVSKELKRIVYVLDNIASNYIESLYSLKRNSNGLIKDNTDDENIRYAGSNEVVKNYVEFGNEGELWRIIGVFDVAKTSSGTTEKRIKIVRDAFSTGMNWDSTSSGNSGKENNSGWGINQWGKTATYEGADIMRLLNGYYIGEENTCTYCNSNNQETCTNDCSSSVRQLSTPALNMIDDALWYTGAIGYIDPLSLSTMYEGERGSKNGKICSSGDMCNDTVTRTTTWLGKIGLIYPSDYAYASTKNDCITNIYGSNSLCKENNWLHPSSGHYWTIAPFATSMDARYVWYIHSSSCVNGGSAADVYGVRPTLYLSSAVKIIDGDGTQSNPYKLSI